MKNSEIVIKNLLITILAGAVSLSTVGWAQIITKSTVGLALAEKMVQACEDEASAKGFLLSIAVVDDAGHPILLKRMDGAGFKTLDVARAKAYTAAILGAPTADLQKNVEQGKTGYLTISGLLAIRGGLPIKYKEKTIGGIAASGASAEQDEHCAQTALDKIQ